MDYNYDSIDLVFAAADTDYEIQWSGARIYVDRSDADFTIKLNSNTNKSINMKSKSEIEAPFDRFYLTTTGAANITLFLSNPKEIRLGGQEVNVDTIEKMEKTPDATYGTVTIGAAAGLIIAANTDRKSLFVQSLTAAVYIGNDASVTTANGLRVNTGETINLDRYTGAVYGIGAGAGNDVRYLEEG